MYVLNLRSLALIAAVISIHTAYAQEAPADEGIVVTAEPAPVEVPVALPERSQKQEVLDVLNSYNLGNNGFYNKALSPAKSLDLNKSESDRTSEMNDKIAGEMDAVLTAFKAADENGKAVSVLEVTKQIEGHLTDTATARIQFIDGNPSAAIARTVILLERTGNEERVNAKNVLDSLTSYKRAAKPRDYAYEYENPEDLTAGVVKSTEGSDSTWAKPDAPAEFEPNKDYVIKKCRQIFGWRCITTLYRASETTLANENIKYLFMGNYDLKNNRDNGAFGGDKRTTNQVAGSTALVVVKESAKWVLVFGVDAQWNRDRISFGSMIQEEYQKDFGRLTQRISQDLRPESKSGDAGAAPPVKSKKKKKPLPPIDWDRGA